MTIVDRLLRSDEPSIRFKIRAGVLGEDPKSRPMRALGEEIRSSPRIAALLAGRRRNGRLERGLGVYAKWQGAHWVLASLADLGYPPGDEGLAPLRDQLMEAWLAERYYAELEIEDKASSYSRFGVPRMSGRYRTCASQHGNALWSVQKLGIADDRCAKLVERLLHWQWPDGGWNCDRDPRADSSSFMETLLPMRGLARYAREKRDAEAGEAVRRAVEVFLERKLFKGRANGKVIHHEFVALHYPLYWHYDILAGLKVMAEIGRIDDPRCADALDLLTSKRLPDGGWPAERKYYKASLGKIELGADQVDWGGTSKRKMNEWVTVDALAVLAAAGRR